MTQLPQCFGFDLADVFARYCERLADFFEGVLRTSATLRDEVRGYDADEFAGCDYLGLLPELWKMALVGGDQIVGAGGVGTFQELVVVGIARYLERTRRDN